MRSFGSLLVATSLILHRGACQYFPPKPEGVRTLKSKFHDGVTISYKEVGVLSDISTIASCGYIHLPPGSLTEKGEAQNYPINIFFWFFEARKDARNAPLSIWLNGGPGSSSATGLLAENGPCFVNPDSKSTSLNPWSWNNEVNILYIDQPVQVGYSYDVATNVTVDRSNMDDKVSVADFSDEVPEQNNTFYVGTYASQRQFSVTNSTNHSAVALWHFAQTWFEEFPHYKPANEKISIWAESYGGHYGPAFSRFFSQQNDLIADGTIDGKGAHYIHLDMLGLVNPYIDALIQAPAYADIAYNNTYGIEAINSSTYELAMHNWEKPGGVKDFVLKCRDLARRLDPYDYGDNHEVNQACSAAAEAIEENLVEPYTNFSNRGWFDIAHPANDPFPPQYLKGYLNQRHVQAALGVPVNHSSYSRTVANVFQLTGDEPRGGYLEDIAYVLDHGMRVALVYGDRDYACNWIGGERVSLAIPYCKAEAFAQAGYEPIVVNSTYVGGQVRQYGNFSFSRVYQSGHMVPAYQPETAYRIFMRAMFGKDIATGEKDVTDDFATKGPADTWHIRNEIPEPPQSECYILSPEGCSEEQWEAVKNGTAVIKDYIFQGFGGDDIESFGHEHEREGVSEQVPINL
ncbi:Carboxypeptidase D [Rasamsonia emersonii CBS 393.64]|uniref:Carboxypeptidase n=1 Tax=Rasamsonia emersonii (strain ATCC 16479 / CBS 393.64 / IMI 116815) TaxID=1408163 RepID=A0A0F4Z2V2_RASE3|nr:Carboxypeptidase D [Rasamsonia emersonii CBS 393.64]KKA24837.1 Carboxypeptidase D [Rasamsonia emersonii CBS 393.64]